MNWKLFGWKFLNGLLHVVTLGAAKVETIVLNKIKEIEKK